MPLTQPLQGMAEIPTRSGTNAGAVGYVTPGEFATQKEQWEGRIRQVQLWQLETKTWGELGKLASEEWKARQQWQKAITSSVNYQIETEATNAALWNLAAAENRTEITRIGALKTDAEVVHARLSAEAELRTMAQQLRSLDLNLSQLTHTNDEKQTLLATQGRLSGVTRHDQMLTSMPNWYGGGNTPNWNTGGGGTGSGGGDDWDTPAQPVNDNWE